MFIANTASVGHKVLKPEFVGAYFTGTETDGGNIIVTPSNVISGLEFGDRLIACITQSDSSVPYYPTTPSAYSGTQYTWSMVSGTQAFSNDSNDSASAVFSARHFGSSYSVNFGASQNVAVTMVQLLAFRNVSTVSVLDVGTTTNSAYVYFPTLSSIPADLNSDGILQFGGGGQYRAYNLGTYPDPGGYDNFQSYQLGGSAYLSGTVGYGFYAPKTLSTSIPSKTWSAAAYNSSAGSTFDMTLRLVK